MVTACPEMEIPTGALPENAPALRRLIGDKLRFHMFSLTVWCRAAVRGAIHRILIPTHRRRNEPWDKLICRHILPGSDDHTLRMHRGSPAAFAGTGSG